MFNSQELRIESQDDRVSGAAAHLPTSRRLQMLVRRRQPHLLEHIFPKVLEAYSEMIVSGIEYPVAVLVQTLSPTGQAPQARKGAPTNQPMDYFDPEGVMLARPLEQLLLLRKLYRVR